MDHGLDSRRWTKGRREKNYGVVRSVMGTETKVTRGWLEKRAEVKTNYEIVRSSQMRGPAGSSEERNKSEGIGNLARNRFVISGSDGKGQFRTHVMCQCHPFTQGVIDSVATQPTLEGCFTCFTSEHTVINQLNC